MKKLFIIGTGRNGSKLTGKVIGTVVDIKNRFGEIHHGLKPIFFKDVYMGKIPKDDAVKRFKKSRDRAMKSREIYTEKNHLIVPMLDQVYEAYPDALFLYVERDPKRIVGSFMSRSTYKDSEKNNPYGQGRLEPNKNDPFFNKWSTMSRLEKVCWYVYTMRNMIEKFLDKLKEDAYYVIKYEDFCKDRAQFRPVIEWLGFDYDAPKVKAVFSVKYGTKSKYPPFDKWSDGDKEAYKRFFDE